MNQENIDLCAKALKKAADHQEPIELLTSRFPDMTNEDAYRIQLLQVAWRQEEGKKIAGKKIGITSPAMQRAGGIHEPDYGHILNDMIFASYDDIPLSTLMQPRVEAELSFLLKRDLQGPGVTAIDVIAATECIVPTLEIVDTRFKDWKIKIQDTIADNASSGIVILGSDYIRPADIDLVHVGMVLRSNGKLIDTGAGAAVLNHPALAVAWLANKLAQFEIVLKANEIILSGSFTNAYAIEPGYYHASFGRHGEVAATFVKDK